jgi:membrane protease YdiL (CAAX protease family)
MIRSIGAVLAGVATAFVLILAVEKLGHLIYPPPAGLDFSDPEAIRPYMATLPFLALLFPMIAWVVGTFAGTLTACKIGTANPLAFAAIVGGLVLAGTIANLIVIPHPVWFSAVSLVAIVAAAWVALQIATSSERADTESPADD